jgi:hypothetical protein
MRFSLSIFCRQILFLYRCMWYNYCKIIWWILHIIQLIIMQFHQNLSNFSLKAQPFFSAFCRQPQSLLKWNDDSRVLCHLQDIIALPFLSRCKNNTTFRKLDLLPSVGEEAGRNRRPLVRCWEKCSVCRTQLKYLLTLSSDDFVRSIFCHVYFSLNTKRLQNTRNGMVLHCQTSLIHQGRNHFVSAQESRRECCCSFWARSQNWEKWLLASSRPSLCESVRIEQLGSKWTDIH